jgi:hypothetical protein
LRGADKELRLKLGELGYDLRAGAVQDFRVAAERARLRAGRIKQDCVEGPAGIPGQRVDGDQARAQFRALEVFADAGEAVLRRVDGGDAMTGRGQLHRLAARCRAQVEDVAGIGRNEPGGK